MNGIDRFSALTDRLNGNVFKPSIFENKECSFYNTIEPVKGNKIVGVLDLLKNPTYSKFDVVERIRECEWNSAEQTRLKESLTAATFSSIQKPSQRSKSDYIAPSGFLQFDIDKIQDPHIIKYKISQLPFTAYCGLSVRGKGVWGLFPIPIVKDADEYEEHFNAMEVLFNNMGFIKEFDTSVKDISRIRFICYDPLAYFNHNARLFTDKLKSVRSTEKKPKPKYKPVMANTKLSGPEKIAKWNNEVDFDTIYNILIDAGYNHFNDTGSKVRFTRPGKQRGISIDYDMEIRTLYLFSSEAPEYNNPVWKDCSGGKCGSPLDILMAYKTKNWREIYSIIDAEFGLK